MSEIGVLIVDDEPGYADLVGSCLERTGDITAVAALRDPATAVERADGSDVDCVVSDHHMPEMTGLELLLAVRERDPDVPFVLYTGNGSGELASRALSAGVTAYVRKGSGDDHYDLLAERIRDAVGKGRTAAPPDREREPLARTGDAAAPDPDTTPTN